MSDNYKYFRVSIMIGKSSSIKILALLLISFLNCSCTISSLIEDKSNLDKPDSVNGEKLLEIIKEYGEQKRVEPIDAVVDRVWKAIPGYNGREVDIEASYKNMEKSGEFDENKIVYKEISPDIHLENLEPQPIYRGNAQKPMVALLINVAWGNEYIADLLRILDEGNIKATFFFDGSWVKKQPDLAKLIYSFGHEVGNHAYSHPDLSKFSKEQTIDELKKTNDIIEQTINVRPKWFAPPSGSYNMGTVLVAEQLGMKTILWTVDTIDWKNPEPQGMAKRVLGDIGNGSMILMHPTKSTVEGLGTIILGIKEKGYQIGTVSELMDEKRID